MSSISKSSISKSSLSKKIFYNEKNYENEKKVYDKNENLLHLLTFKTPIF